MKTFSFKDVRAMRGADVEKRVLRRSKELAKTLPMSFLRSACSVTQSEIAKRLGISQAAVSKLEGRGDVLLSTLHRYTHALGGTVRISLCFENEKFVLTPTGDGDIFAMTKQIQSHASNPFLVSEFLKVHAAPAPDKPSPDKHVSLWERRHQSVQDVTINAQLAVANDHHNGYMEAA